MKKLIGILFPRMFKCIVFIALFTPAVWSYSAGAPKDICLSNDPNIDLFPQHHDVKSQTSPIPYTLSGPSKVKAGETVSFTLKGNNNLTFKGFIMQGRANGQPVGSFTPKTNSQTVDCKGAKVGIRDSLLTLLSLNPNFFRTQLPTRNLITVRLLRPSTGRHRPLNNL